MEAVGSVLVWIVAVLHVGFFVLESVLWTRPTGRRIFGLSKADAQTTASLASNQGVYNAMVGIGLVWGAVTGASALVSFLLVFVVVVGIYGAITVKPTIFVIQALPALGALGAFALA